MHFGTMGSGKSLDIIRTIYNYTDHGFKVLLLKPAVDLKGGDCVKTRVDDKSISCDYVIGEDEDITETLTGKLLNVKCIFVDEAQFLTSLHVYQLLEIAKSADINIICYGLRSNFKMEPFKGGVALFGMLEHMDELIAICAECGNVARHVARKINGEYVSDGEEVVIDGEDTTVEYVQICAKCYLEKVKKVDLPNLRRRLLYGTGENSK